MRCEGGREGWGGVVGCSLARGKIRPNGYGRRVNAMAKVAAAAAEAAAVMVLRRAW